MIAQPSQWLSLETSLNPISNETLPEEKMAVFLPGESHGQRSLVVYTPWGCKELDTTGDLAQHSTALSPWSGICFTVD